MRTLLFLDNGVIIIDNNITAFKYIIINAVLMDTSLFDDNTVNTINKPQKGAYDASQIEVLEGLEPVRMRPGMYVGGTDENALHHLFKEVLDNAMDEAIAGYATVIEVELIGYNTVKIKDNGRGIPVDPHPKYPQKSALEVILTTLHSGGKFSNQAYEISGGLHGVGISVVNALSSDLEVCVLRDSLIYTQSYQKGIPVTNISSVKTNANETGTIVTFTPDVEIFADAKFDCKKLYDICTARAYLFPGIKIIWQHNQSGVLERDIIHYPNGLKDYIGTISADSELVTNEVFHNKASFADAIGTVEWALIWCQDNDDAKSIYYCNTIYTPLGGSHEAGFRSAIFKGLKSYCELKNDARINSVAADDVFSSIICIVSIFMQNPLFQGQTKDKLISAEAQKLVENAVKIHFENWLTTYSKIASSIIDKIFQDAMDRINRKKQKSIARKNPMKYLRLPGKLADCSNSGAIGTELFLVEGDSAGGSAKQARNRENQAILPLKGKILNVASASMDKIFSNAEIKDLITALGCQCGKGYKSQDLRYEKIIIMTDADVDGAHISTLLMTFFYKQMPQLILDGHLFLAQPPLYKVVYRNNQIYVSDDKSLQKLIKKHTIEKLMISRFKGLGEMTAPQLKETTMDPNKRSLLKVVIDDEVATDIRVSELMGKDSAPRFKFIQEYAQNNLILD